VMPQYSPRCTHDGSFACDHRGELPLSTLSSLSRDTKAADQECYERYVGIVR
jgi:hypothetical protein